MNRSRHIAVTLISFLFVLTSTLSNANTHHTGATLGQFQVGASGEASYSIPLAIPPGIAGMQPSLSLAYNSQAGNGSLGMGWALGGLSVVHRCPATLIQDGYKGGISYTSDDKLCIDGQRLVAVSGVYGADGTEYRTEKDSYSKIISYGVAGSGPQWFKVWTKGGQIMEYGNTSDSAIEIEGVGETDIRVWAVNKISDTVNNYLMVTYTENNADGEYYPKEIKYTGNTTTGMLPVMSVKFVYETRPDIGQFYSAGSLIKNTQRVTNIQTYINSTTLIKDYRFGYEIGTATSRSRLTSLEECDAASECKPASTFQWQEGVDGIYAPVVFTNIASTSYAAPYWSSNQGDANGDGLTDLIMTYRASGTFWTVVSLANRDGTYSQDIKTTKYEAPGDDYPESTWKLNFGDANGDGMIDVILSYLSSSGTGNGVKTAVALSNGDGSYASMVITQVAQISYLAPYWSSNFGDANGDGLTDLIMTYRVSGTFWTAVSLANGDGTYSQNIQTTKLKEESGALPESTWKLDFGDANGDGMIDVILTYSSTAGNGIWSAVSLSNGDGYYASIINTSIASTGYSAPSWQFTLGDANGDGLTDVIGTYVYESPAGDGIKTAVSLSNGDGSYAPVVFTNLASTGYSAPSWKFTLGDANGDGLTDVIGTYVYESPAGDGIKTAVSLSNGDGSYAPVVFTNLTSTGYSAPSWKFTLGDANGDGLTDVIGAYVFESPTGDGIKTAVSLSNGVFPDLLTTITNGLGDATSVTYKPLTDASVYTKGSGAVYPEIDIQAPMYVVSHYETDSGIGGTHGFDYTYGEAKAHVMGHGFLGFGFMETTDTNTGIKTRVDYNQTFPTNGVADSIEVRLSDDTLIEQTTNTWQSSTNTDPDNDPTTSEALHTITLANTTKRTHELNGAQISRAYTDHLYDSYGNVTNINVVMFNGSEGWVSTKSTVNTYTNDTFIGHWYLGRLNRAEVTSITPSHTATRVSSFGYHAQTGLLTHEIIEPDQVNFTLLTSYGYDSYGHKTLVTVLGNASATDPIVTRTTTTSYDYTNLTVDGTYNTTTTNALSHTETKTIDARFGVVTSLTGPNLLTTTWDYDTLGRKTKESRADNTYTTITYDHCDAITPCAPAQAALKITNQVASTTAGTTALPASITYFDKLGREVRSEGVGFDGTAVYKDTVYNNRGKVAQVSLPYFVGAATIHQTSYTYDDLGRVTTETRPDTSIVTRTYAMTAGGHETIERIQHVGDAIDQSTTKLNNSLGQLIKVTDNATGTIQYAYDAFGNLLTTTDSAVIPNVVTMTYDIRGRKTAMDDPDMGHWEYKHNALGELIWQKDANLNEVTMAYDQLGRMVSRTELEGISTWIYDGSLNPSQHNIGKLTQVAHSAGNYSKSISYDAVGRPYFINTVLDGTAHFTVTTYDAYSRKEIQGYPNGFATKHSYNTQGFLNDVRDNSTNALYWQADEANALGQTTLETFGNNVQTVRQYDEFTGRMVGITSGVGVASDIQSLAYAYDALGNLNTRQDTNRALTEDFTYDNLNRLTGVTLNSVQGSTYQYDSIGNITNKSDVGSYTYGENGAGPHAVTTAGANTYTYDPNGNQITGGGRTVAYSSYNKPTLITKGNVTREFKYGPDRARYQQIATEGTASGTVLEDNFTSGSLTNWTQGTAGTLSIENDPVVGNVVHKASNSTATTLLSSAVTDFDVSVQTRRHGFSTGNLNRYALTTAGLSGFSAHLSYSSSELCLLKQYNGSYQYGGTNCVTLPNALVYGQWYTLRMKRQGADVTASVYDGQVDVSTATPVGNLQFVDHQYGL